MESSESQPIQERSGDKIDNTPKNHWDAANLILWEIIHGQEDSTIAYITRESLYDPS